MSVIDRLAQGVLCQSALETQALAGELARSMPEDTVLAINGAMGSGKTTFVQGMAKAWGIRETVTSPTFAIYAPYRGTRMLIHVDAYRLTGAGEGEALHLEDLLESPWCIAVEWPDRIGSVWWMQDAWQLRIISETEILRKISLSTA